MKLPIKAALILCAAGISIAQAAEVATTPVGVVTLTIPAAPNSTSPRYSIINIPLGDNVQYAGTIGAVGSNTLTLSTAISETLSASNPHLLQITSGSHSGRTFQINSNSGNTVTVDVQGTNLNALEPPIGENGVSYQIRKSDTLASIFGDATQGGTSAAMADQVWIWSPSSGQYNKYFYHTTNNRWQDTTFGSPSNNVVLRPDHGIMYVRRGTTPLEVVVTGEVKATDTLIRVRESGFTLASGGFPVATTIGALALQSNSAWNSSNVANNSDQIWIWSAASGQYNKYFYHAGNARWQDTTFGSPSNAVSLPAGSAVMIKRAALQGANFQTLSFPKPYAL